jgi:dTDP-4-amino-4,6-dideoxygalactose transaminase
MIKFVDLTKNYLKIKEEIDESINNNIINSQFINGNDKQQFESKFSKYIGTDYCVGVANGTDALEIAIQSLEMNSGSEIIVQPNTYISTALAITNVRHKPVFVDIDEQTMMIDVDKIEEKITKNTKAICVVHLFGSSPNMDKLLELTKKYNLYLIEDCAQSHGSFYNNQRTGTFGDVACFSFYPGKNLGCYGDGGAICTNNATIYYKIKLLHNLGFEKKHYHETKGRNSKLDTIQAGILNIKLKYLDENNEKRRIVANIYLNELESLNDIVLPTLQEGSISVWHLFVIRILDYKRELLQKYLFEHNIETGIHYPIPIHKQNAFTEHSQEILPICEKVSHELLSLPMHPELEVKDVIYICNCIKQFYKLSIS